MLISKQDRAVWSSCMLTQSRVIELLHKAPQFTRIDQVLVIRAFFRCSLLTAKHIMEHMYECKLLTARKDML